MSTRSAIKSLGTPLKQLSSGASRSAQTAWTRYYSTESSAKTYDAGPSEPPSRPRKGQPTAVPLSRPLGVDVPPVSSPKTYVKVSDKLYDSDRSRAERQVLLKEASRGYFHDYHRASREPGGKQWIAPKVLIKEEMALYFPNIAGTNLMGEKTNTTDLLKGKVSLVTIISTKLSEEQVDTFIQPVLGDQKGNDEFNFVQINHQQNVLKAAMLSFFTSGLKRQVDESLWSNYLLARGEWSELDVSVPMGIDNKIVGYVFLVDANCKIRWAGSGAAHDEEVQSLRTATAVLLQRHKTAARESKTYAGTTP